MNKKVVLIIIIGIIVLAAGIAVWWFLRPMLEAQRASVPAYHDAWKLERIQGSWASANAEYVLSIDGYDCALQIDGVYALLASIQFDTSEKWNAENARFTLPIDPSSVIHPDAEGAARYEIEALWYEDDRIGMHLLDVEGVNSGPIAFSHIEVSPPPSWPYN